MHGTDANTTDNWWPWLRKLLEGEGYEIFAPVLPDNHTPSWQTYETFLKDSGWDFSDNLLVGHSSGATTILNLLSTDWFPKVKTVVLAGTFINEKLTKSADWYETGQFDNLFLTEYSPEKLKQKADSFYFVHGDNDPYCDIEDARKLCSQLEGTFIVVPNGHHLWSTSGLKEIPQMAEQLIKDNVL